MMTQMHQQTLAKADCCGLLAAIHLAVAFLRCYLHSSSSIEGEDLLLMAEYHVIFHGLFLSKAPKGQSNQSHVYYSS